MFQGVSKGPSSGDFKRVLGAYQDVQRHLREFPGRFRGFQVVSWFSRIVTKGSQGSPGRLIVFERFQRSLQWTSWDFQGDLKLSGTCL